MDFDGVWDLDFDLEGLEEDEGCVRSVDDDFGGDDGAFAFPLRLLWGVRGLRVSVAQCRSTVKQHPCVTVEWDTNGSRQGIDEEATSRSPTSSSESRSG